VRRLGGKLLLALCALSACKGRPDAADDACVADRCVTLEDDDGMSPIGVSDVGHVMNDGSYRYACRFVVRRAGGRGSGLAFTGAIIGEEDDVVILDGALGKVRHCHRDAWHTIAVLELNPSAYLWAIPDKGHVFIPFDNVEDTVLEDGAYARARLQREGSDLQGRICITQGQLGVGQDFQCGFHVGDSFTWGSHRAEIVRLVEPHGPIVGWVEASVH
jgi:hypothetical protein